MFRAAKSNLHVLQRGTTRQQHHKLPPIQLSSQFSVFLGQQLPSNDDKDRKISWLGSGGLATENHPINATQLLRSFRGFSQQSGTQAASSGLRSFPIAGASRRGFATSSSSGPGSDECSSSVESTLETLFRENEVIKGDEAAWVDGSGSAAMSSSSGLDFVPTWYNPADICLEAIMKVQELSGTELGWAIVGATLIVRTILVPVVIKGQRLTTRMAHASPELRQLQKKYTSGGKRPQTMEEVAKMQKAMRAVYQKYGMSSPWQAMLVPFIQFPVMVGMFFGLKKMPDYFPDEMAAGGILWITDLAVPDPTYALPIICGVTFVATVELGKDQMIATSPDTAPMMITFMRFMSLAMFGVCTTFHAGLTTYFAVTNVFTMVQMMALKTPAVKKFFDIWDTPKPVPGQDSGLGEMMKDLRAKITNEKPKQTPEQRRIRQIQQHNEMVAHKKNLTAAAASGRSNRRRSIKKR